MTTNVTTLPAGQKPQFSLTPQSLDEAMRFADMLSKSALVPKDYQGNPANCVIAMQWGMEIGLQPLQAMQSIAVINGRPAIWGDAMIALVRGSGLLESIVEDPTETGCSCTVKRRGEAPVTRTFTLEDAKRAGLAGKQGPWQQHTKRMLQMRARAFALRDVFPDVLRGVYVAEEARDLPVEKDMGAAEEVTQAASTKPASRGDRARAALADKRGNAQRVPAVTLDAVLREIAAAETPEAMHAAADSAGQLAGDDKATAREAYQLRVAALKAAAEQTTVDAETGEITDDNADFLAGYESVEQE